MVTRPVPIIMVTAIPPTRTHFVLLSSKLDESNIDLCSGRSKPQPLSWFSLKMVSITEVLDGRPWSAWTNPQRQSVPRHPAPRRSQDGRPRTNLLHGSVALLAIDQIDHLCDIIEVVFWSNKFSYPIYLRQRNPLVEPLPRGRSTLSLKIEDVVTPPSSRAKVAPGPF